MFPNLHAEIIRTRQQEIATRTRQARHIHDAVSGSPRPRRNRTIVGRTVAIVGVCLTTGTAIVVSDAGARTSGGASAAHFAREVRALEAKGYAPSSCRAGGALQMRNARTGQLVTVRS